MYACIIDCSLYDLEELINVGFIEPSSESVLKPFLWQELAQQAAKNILEISLLII